MATWVLSHLSWLARSRIQAFYLLTTLAGPAQENPPVLATVNGIRITAVEVREMALKNERNLTTAEGFEAALLDAVNFEILAAEAEKLGYQNDSEIRRLVKTMAVQRMLKEQVEAPGAPPSTRGPAATAEKQPRPASESITVTEDELKTLYEQSRAEFAQPTLVRGQVLFLLKRQGMEADHEKKLADVNAAMAGGAGFGDLVAKFSDNPAARTNGGMTPWLVEAQEDKQFPKEVVGALFAAKDAKAITGPIEAGQGAYYVKLVERREGRTMKFGEARRVLYERIHRRKASAAYDRFVAGLAKDAQVERNAEGIASMQKAVAKEAGRPPAGPVTIRPAESQPAAPPEKSKSKSGTKNK